MQLDGPDREQVQAAERLTLLLPDGRGSIAVQQRVRQSGMCILPCSLALCHVRD